VNVYDDVQVDQMSFSFLESQGKDAWQPWTPVFGSLTIVGTPSYFGRLRFVGRKCEFQVKFSAGTSIASVAGTDFLNLPVAGQGFSGMAIMSNDSLNTAVGVCHIDVATGRCYLPAQVASANVFNIAGSYEV